MDLERLLISKVIFTGQVEAALARNITDDHFADDECRTMWSYLVSHVRKYKSSPSLDAVKHDNPSFEFIQCEQTIEWVIDRFSSMVKRRFADEMLLELGKAADDRDRAENIDLEFLHVAQYLIKALPTGKVSRVSEAEKRIDDYEQRLQSGKLRSVPYGIPTLDRDLGGILPHELVTVLGWTNVGKSTLLRTLAINMWMKDYTPLYFSLEEGADEILSEFDAMAAKLSRQKLRQLDLSDEEMSNWRKFADFARGKSSCDIPVIDSLYRMTPDQVYAETLRHKPDVVIIDYIGLMRSSNYSRGIARHHQISEITQDLKINARMLRIPIIIAAQTNRLGAKGGADLDNVADGISISQDSDTVIGLFQNEEMERNKEMEIRVNKSRKGPKPRFRMIWDHAVPEFREKTMKDLMFRSSTVKESDSAKNI